MGKKKFWKIYFFLLIGLSLAEAITPFLTKEPFLWSHFIIYEIAIAIIVYLALRFTTNK